MALGAVLLAVGKACISFCESCSGGTMPMSLDRQSAVCLVHHQGACQSLRSVWGLDCTGGQGRVPINVHTLCGGHQSLLGWG